MLTPTKLAIHLAHHEQKPFRLLAQPKKIPRDLKTRVHYAARNKKTDDIPTGNELNDLTDMLLGCLNLNVEKRATAGQAIQHRFFTSPAAPKPASQGLLPSLPKPASQGFPPSLLPSSVQG